jgi:ribosomal protein S18 acetylase RimI-like enzyme
MAISSKLEITRAKAEDVHKLHALYIEAASWMASQGIDQWELADFPAEFMNKLMEKAEVFAVRYEGVVMGGFSIQWTDKSIWKELDSEEAGYVHKLVVKRAYSGLGVGLEMLDWAGNYLRSHNKRWVRLDCMADNTGLNSFYIKAGFQFKRRVDGKTWSANLYEKEIL